MAAFRLRSIRAKLWALTAATVGLLGVTQCLGLVRLHQSAGTITDQGNALRQNGDVAACQQAFARLQRWTLDLAVSLLTQSETEIEAARKELQSALTLVAVHHPDEAERLRAPTAAFDQAMLAAVDAYTDENRVLGNSMVAEARQHAAAADTILATLAQQVSEHARAMSDRVVADARSTLVTGIAGLAGGVVAATLFALWLVVSIARSVRRMSVGIATLSRNDLTACVEPSTHDELGRMATSFSRAVAGLRTLVVQARNTSHDLRQRSTSTQHTAEKLADGARDNAATTEEMSSTIQQLNETITLVGKNASNVCTMADAAARTATEGSTTVEQTAVAMRAVQQSTQKIGQITETVEMIARQTNLLALNAAVEAARAGEAGRGFAVVSEEVRALASRASTAAAEIHDTVQTITKEITHGVALSDQATATLARIRREIGGAATSIAEIARATEEQGLSTAEVSKAILIVANNTQTVSGGSEELVGVSQQLLGDVDRLFGLLAAFAIDSAEPTAPTTTASSTAGH